MRLQALRAAPEVRPSVTLCLRRTIYEVRWPPTPRPMGRIRCAYGESMAPAPRPNGRIRHAYEGRVRGTLRTRRGRERRPAQQQPKRGGVHTTAARQRTGEKRPTRQQLNTWHRLRLHRQGRTAREASARRMERCAEPPRGEGGRPYRMQRALPHVRCGLWTLRR